VEKRSETRRGTCEKITSAFGVRQYIIIFLKTTFKIEKEGKMSKIEKPEDVVVVPRREWMRLSALGAAGSVVLGALNLGATEPPASGSPATGADDSDRVFGGAESGANTGWEIIAAWVALTTRSDKLTDCLLYRGQNGECSKLATEDLNLNEAGWRQARDFLLTNGSRVRDQLARSNEIWWKLANTYNGLYVKPACPSGGQIRDLAQGLSRP